MGIGNFFRHPLQVIGDAMYQQEPVFQYPTIDQPLSADAPDGTHLDLGGRVPLDPAGMPQQVGTRRTGQKTALGRILTEVAPRAIEAGMAGMATPNIAGGGALDFARAFQAGGHALRQRDIDAWHMDQQRQAAAERAAESAAQRDLYEAHAAEYRHQTEQPPKQEKKTYTLPPGAVMVDETGKLVYTNPQGRPADSDYVAVDEETGKRFGVVPDEFGVYHVPKAALHATPPPKEDKPQKPWRQSQTDSNGNVTVVTEQPDGSYKVTPVGPIGKKQKEKAAAGAKPADPTTEAAGRFLAQAGGDAAKARALAAQAAQSDPDIARNLQPILKGIDSAREHSGGKQDSMQKLRGLYGGGATPGAGASPGTADPLGIR